MEPATAAPIADAVRERSGMAIPIASAAQTPEPLPRTLILIGNPAKFALISEAMGEEVEGLPLMEAASLAVEAVKELLDQLKIPIRLRDYGISKKDIPKLGAGAMKASRHFVPNPRNLTKKDVGEI